MISVFLILINLFPFLYLFISESEFKRHNLDFEYFNKLEFNFGVQLYFFSYDLATYNSLIPGEMNDYLKRKALIKVTYVSGCPPRVSISIVSGIEIWNDYL